MRSTCALLTAAIACIVAPPSSLAQSPAAAQPSAARTTVGTAMPPALAPDYTIGPDDLLTIVFWRQKDLSGDVVVRPDGKITLPLLNDVPAAGLTPEQLRQLLIQEAQPFVEEPTATVIVKEINSRKVFITGNVAKPGPYPLTGAMNVLQLIALAGGLSEFTSGKNIVVMRNEGGRPVGYRFNYRHVSQRKNLRQNIQLKPGDTVVVP